MDNVVALILACVLANHMGLISAIERIFRIELPILNCVRCATFWVVFIYFLIGGKNVIASIAISFLSSYVAIWLELFFGFIDVCYDKIYDKIYKDSAEDNAEKNTHYNNTSCSESKMS